MDYSKILNPKVKNMNASGIRKFFDIAATMDDVISLSVGEPDFVTPKIIRDAGIKTLEAGITKYTSNRGLEELRDEISRFIEKKYGITYSGEDEILVTVGGSEAIDMAIRAIVSPGDEVIIPQPSYVCYEPITVFSSGVPVIIETKAEDEFKLKAEDLKAAITDKTKLLVLPFPCNPTGAIMERKDLEEIAEVIKDTNIMVLSDEIYAELTYNGIKHSSIAQIPGMKERTILINGFSKTFAMTGWRMGYACGPKEIIAEMMKIHQYAIMCAPTLSQNAALTALKECTTEVDEMMASYDKRRKITVDLLNDAGLSCNMPKGAFYAFPSIKSTGLSSDEFCERVLRECHVAVIPGSSFGAGGEGFIRVCYCYDIEEIKEGVRRIKEFVQKL
ncbi:MAG: aminotransferase class I/II-fold pyridoxal phosphate-dependent enzyme [Clostridia bacterium]|nr:aminotransferase class I/II-fold pyridoxal phosphate-dependent enzyme [Clostridia bacterium]